MLTWLPATEIWNGIAQVMKDSIWRKVHERWPTWGCIPVSKWEISPLTYGIIWDYIIQYGLYMGYIWIIWVIDGLYTTDTSWDAHPSRLPDFDVHVHQTSDQDFDEHRSIISLIGLPFSPEHLNVSFNYLTHVHIYIYIYIYIYILTNFIIWVSLPPAPLFFAN